MTLILGVNDALAIAVATLCWWMAHVSATAGGWFRRLVAVGYGAVGLTTLTIALFRTFVDDYTWLPILGKVSFVVLLAFIAIEDRQK